MWSDYIRPDLISQFEEEFNCKVTVDTYDSNESMYTKLLFGAEGYDVLFPSTYYLDLMIGRDFIDKLDLNLLPNASLIDWKRLSDWGLEHSEYGLPYMVSFSGLGYRKDRIPEPTSWDIFADAHLKGRMTLLNDPRETIGAALRFLGYSINTYEPAKINEAKEVVLRWKTNCAKFESEQYKNGIASAEFLVSHGYSSDLLQVAREIPEVGFAYPKEGSIAACDCAVVMKHSTEKELAHAFINFLQRPEIAKENMLTTCAFCPNLKALESMTFEERMEGQRYPSASMTQAECIRHVFQAQMLYIKAWDQIKSTN